MMGWTGRWAGLLVGLMLSSALGLAGSSAAPALALAGGEPCQAQAALAEAGQLVPVPPLNPAYGAAAGDTPFGRCGRPAGHGLDADLSCGPTLAQEQAWLRYRGLMEDALWAEGVEPFTGPLGPFLMRYHFMGGDACRGPLWLASDLLAARALARCALGRPPLVVPGAALDAPPDCRLFGETGQAVCGPFRRYWEARGGLVRFGYPLSPPFDDLNPGDGRAYTVQYFERARFAWHIGAPGDVRLERLGYTLTLGRENEAPFQRVTDPGDGSWFAETGHRLRGRFRDAWAATGGLESHGLPLSAEFVELNPDDGQRYTVQYFEYSRFEYHPDQAGTPYEVQFGQLGRQVYTERGQPAGTP
jgi:hypothetical protein